MKNRKGFTLTELLGVIVILLLLVLIVTPIFINYTKKASNTAYDVQINTIKESAREWALDDANVKLLPTKDNECVKVSLEKLKEAGFLDFNITNPKTGEKFADESAVVIRKSGKKLTYTFDEDDNITCENVIAADYPRWVFVSSTPAVASDTDTVTVNIKSDRAISEESLQPENITVKVGSKIVDDANVVVACNGVNPLTCSLQISNLSGNGKLSLIIDKETMKDEDLNPSRITNIQTNTIVDTTGPIISYTGKENTNASIYYATKDDTVKIKFKAEDNGTITNNLQASDIIVYLDGTEITCTKDLTTTGSGSTINYELRLSNVEGNGKVTIKIPSGKIADNMGNLNGEKIISPGITFDNIKPTIEYDPSGSTAYLRDVDITITATDNETGINADSLKYIFTTDQNATPTTSIINGEKIHRENLNGDYYVIGYVCDYAGNCATVPSNVYRMNNQGPSISIVPDHNSGYATSATFKINVTSNGEALDEGSFKYIVATSKSAAVNKSFTNNTNITMDNLTGTYYVVAEACDVSGLCTRKESDEFYLDNEAPAISLSPNGSSWSKSVSVAIGVSDNVNVDWAKYIVSTNKTATPETTISNNSATATVTSTNTTGTYYVITKACDGLGNCKQSVSNPYYIDNTNPGIGNISVTPQASANPKTTISTVTVTDDVALARYEIYNSSGTRLVSNNISGKSANISYTQNARGTYTLKVYDHLGNMSSKNFTVPGYTITFNVNNTAMGSVGTGSVTVNYGETASTTYAAKSGYRYKSVSSGCSASNGTVSASNVTGAKTCTVTFEKNEFTVKFQSADTSMGTVGNSNNQTIVYGNTASTSVSPKDYLKYSSVSCTNGMTATYSNGTVTTGAISSDTVCTVSFTCNLTSKTFSYKGSMQSITIPKTCQGTYTLEVWGAAGGYNGGKGGYSKGTVNLTAGTTLYIGVGGAGDRGNGGYNGGGSGGSGDYDRGSGGGATHIGKTNNLLKDTSSGNLYIVAGGGGGGTVNQGGSTECGHPDRSSARGGDGNGGKYGSNNGNGDAGGGTGYTEGCGWDCISRLAGGGTQSSGGQVGVGYDCMSTPTRYEGPNPGSYGQGGNGDPWRPGGGGGYYGGGSAGVGASFTAGGGGGSGYFGSGVTATASSKGVKTGNGEAKITKN